MPVSEAPYIIGVIREKEKAFIQEDEVTRLTHATSMDEIKEVLLSTPYAIGIEQSRSVIDGISTHLEDEFAWLSEHVDNAKIVAFIGARYDALHIALALIALSKGTHEIPQVPRIGTLSGQQVVGLVFEDDAQDGIAASHFMPFVREQKWLIAEGTWTLEGVYRAMQEEYEAYVERLACTDLTRAIAAYIREKHASSEKFRENLETQNASEYEAQWDAKLLALVQPYRYVPVGYDPIVAYWFTKEMEAKTLHMLCVQAPDPLRLTTL